MKVINYIAGKITSWYLTKNNIAWIDSKCECPRSPDVTTPSKCLIHNGESLFI